MVGVVNLPEEMIGKLKNKILPKSPKVATKITISIKLINHL